MLSERLGMRPQVRALFPYLTERWDGKGMPGKAEGSELPLAVRIAHVARDAAFQHMVGGAEHAAGLLRQRAGGAFDPDIAACMADDAEAILSMEAGTSAWDELLESEPRPWRQLEGEAVGQALAAVGNFADLASPYLVGHSTGVAELARAAGHQCRFSDDDVAVVYRAALVHDLGRVAVPVRIWQKATPLTADDWEQVRLHPYHSERILARSTFLAPVAGLGSHHHECLDGSGYHRGARAAALPPLARLLAASDAYHAMSEPRPHRAPREREAAARLLMQEAETGRLDADAVSAVLEAAGHPKPRLERPAGLTEREVQVVGLLARGYQTKQIGRALGISGKTADRHVQNAYTKMGVSTRAAAALFAMEHGLAVWENSRWEQPARPGQHTATAVEKEEAEMAVVMMVDNSKGSQEVYDKVRAHLGIDRPAGGIFHVAGPSPTGASASSSFGSRRRTRARSSVNASPPRSRPSACPARRLESSSGRCTTPCVPDACDGT